MKKFSMSWIIGGNFNVVYDASEKLGRLPIMAHIRHFRRFIDEAKLIILLFGLASLERSGGRIPSDFFYSLSDYKEVKEQAVKAWNNKKVGGSKGFILSVKLKAVKLVFKNWQSVVRAEDSALEKLESCMNAVVSVAKGTSPDAEVAMILQACQLCEEDNCPANCFVIIESDSLMVVSWANGISGVGNTKLLDSIWRLKIFCLDLDRRLLFILFLGVAMLLRIFWLNKVLRMAWFKLSGLVELGLLRVGLMRLSENVGLPKDGSQLKSAIIDLIIFDGLIRPSLIRRWKSVAYNERNRLQMGCVVQLWSFRVGSNLWFALVNLNLKQEENVDSSSTGITSI
ncbi:hypothetical protein LWI28_025964 [Acer negundo]|uniref:Uncharacterized protein n=1 Tax=Acer negundo TaxID=4023 RepID=A0AAD5NQX3_ACENE|nr:hypothetical protein LWI28_025964 [Acer negundo]